MKNSEEYRLDLLARASACWDAMSRFRTERERCKRFTYGDQWSDPMPNGAGAATEEDYIVAQGNIPLKNNLIRRLVRNVLGVFRNQWDMPRCEARDIEEAGEARAMERLLAYNIERNRLEELYARTMEEFLISGMAVHRKWFGKKGRNIDCWTDYVSPEHFFLDSDSRDFRNWDISIIGEYHDMTFQDIASSFALKKEDYDRLSKIYYHSAVNGREYGKEETYKVVEVWTKEYIPRYVCHDPLTGRCFRIGERDLSRLVTYPNQIRRENGADESSLISARWIMDEEWHYHFLTSEGIVLSKGKTPYSHGGHPYTLKLYPFIDGEIHSFVADIIDQQKFTNRLISMYDWILRASAKGVLLIPEGSLPEGVKIQDIAAEWSRFNGVIMFKPKAGEPIPQQINSKISSNGITDLLALQMEMMEDIAGVNGALQGKLTNNSMSGTLYDQQTRNSLTALADLMQSYNDFILEGTKKDAHNIRQFYSQSRLNAILGDVPSLEARTNFFNSDFDFTIRIGE